MTAEPPTPGAPSAPIMAWISANRELWPKLLTLFALIIPAGVGIGLIAWIGPDNNPLDRYELDRLRSGLAPQAYLPGTILIAAALTVHVCICLAGLLASWINLRAYPRPPRGHPLPLLLFAIGLASAVVASIACFRHDTAAYELTFDWVFTLLRGTPVEGALAPMMWLPIGLGVFSLAVVAAAANRELGWAAPPASSRDPSYEANLILANARLKQYLYLLSIGLVASTAAVSLFLALPAKIAQGDLWPGATPLEQHVQQANAAAPGASKPAEIPADATALEPQIDAADAAAKLQTHRQTELATLRGKLEAFASELSLFWGAVFALTLIVAIGVPILRLQRAAATYLATVPDNDAQAANKRLGDAGLLAQGFDKLKLLVALLAPLATGSLAGFMQAAFP